MVSSITAASAAQPVTPIAPAPGKNVPSQTQQAPAADNGDTVHLSNTAQALHASLQEATETPAQTASEASRGDHQAQRLLTHQEQSRVAR